MIIISILIAIFVAFINWRILKQNEVIVDAYANIMVSYSVVQNKLMSPWGSSNKDELKKIKLDSYENNMLSLDKKLEFDKVKMQIYLGDGSLAIYKKIHELIKDWYIAVIFYGDENVTKEKRIKYHNIVYGINEDFNKKIDEYKNETDTFFKKHINSPYKSYICIKLKCGT